QASTEELEGIRGVSEGIQNRMQQAATKAQNFSDFMELTKTKRYSNARLQRTALQILLNAKSKASSPYIRILGMNKTGQKYLSLHKKHISLPLVTTVSKAPPGLLEEELRATNIYTLVKKLENYQAGDFHIPPILTL
ncbi:nucleotidyltransferase family protein, partial [Listeria monocytogenes]|nr:nucleotidyltransferase family protein [Listeria monocytogenes]